MIKIDNRQFLITNQSIEYSDFIKEKLGNFWILYDRNANISKISDAEGCIWYLIGEAFRADVVHSTPAEAIRSAKTIDVPNLSLFWAGKWTLLSSFSMYTDCVGLNSMYYWSRGDIWFASPSMHVLIKSNPLLSETALKLIKNISFDWYPAPLTYVNDVYKTFAGQIFKIFKDKLVVEYQNTIIADYKSLTEDEKCSLLCNYMDNILQNISLYSGKEMWLALTAGADSRSILSILLNRRIPFESFTFDYWLITSGDKNIPKLMSKEFGFNHMLIKPTRKADASQMTSVDIHTYGNIDDYNKLFIAKGQYEQIPDDTIIIKSAIFEIGKGFYYPVLENGESLRTELFNVYPDLQYHERYKESLDLWFDWVESHPNTMDIRDRLYMEQRNSGWIANLEQSLEILPQITIHPANCAAVVSIFSAFNEKEIEEEKADYYLIDSFYPRLNDFPVNPKDYFRMFKYYSNKIFSNPFGSVLKGIDRLGRIMSGR